MDQAIAQAMSQSALDLYLSEGIGSIYYVTAGDERVCPICEANEAGSPYTPDQVPLPAVHPRCRCVLTSDNPEPFKALAGQLIGQPFGSGSESACSRGGRVSFALLTSNCHAAAVLPGAG